ncbi:FAR1-related protein [Striga asiatica]|uniref:FAR1-related protein n=1 Tax=Striga asiatica TaxID=4170 RepID=A0A5A7PTM5_STRAF|nr:FAR1-related protein [Striga asiatica]
MEEPVDLVETQEDSIPISAPQPHQLTIMPGGTMYWIPHCDDALRPFKGQRFQGLNKASVFYNTYASTVGFDVRHNTLVKARDKTVLWKYLVCLREGYKHHTNTDQSVCPQRGRVSNRVSCNARIVLRVDGLNNYVV